MLQSLNVQVYTPNLSFIGCSSLQSIWHLPNLIIQYTGADHSGNCLTNRANVTFSPIHAKVLLYLQFTTSVVGILDGISDWPEDVVQEQSSVYVYNSHSSYAQQLVN